MLERLQNINKKDCRILIKRDCRILIKKTAE